MARIARIVLENIPYHVTQRGNGGQQVFVDEQDYRLYLDLLRIRCEKAGLGIWAYCLMPNHVHLIAVPDRKVALARALGGTHRDFARFYNLRKRTCGHVWQARYYSTPLDDAHLWQAMAYVERNPQRARMVERAEDYRWSSARLRQECVESHDLVNMKPWQAHYDWPRWQEVLATSINEEAFGQRLQDASRRGRPLGGEPFTRELEQRLGRTLTALPAGRKNLRTDEKVQIASGSGI